MERKNNSKLNYSDAYDRLNIIEEELPDLHKYYEIARSRCSACNKSWGSPERYVNALYWMKFVKKYDWHDMAEITGKNFVSVRYSFAPFYWYNDYQTLEECEEASSRIKASINASLAEMDLNPGLFNREDYLSNPYHDNNSSINTKTGKTFHVKKECELFKMLFYLYIIKQIPSNDIAFTFGITANNLRNYLTKYHINLSRKEARKRTEALNRGNHIKSKTSFQKKRLKQALIVGLSNDYELLFRDLIGSYIIDYLDENEYESIIGIQTLSIFPPLV